VKDNFKTNIFVLVTMAETPKMAEIRNFQNVDAIFKKKVGYLGNIRVTVVLQDTKNVQNDFLHLVD